jgi:hypothetical protein
LAVPTDQNARSRERAWKLADLTSKGGALHGALRTYRALGTLPATVEIHLEGPIDRRDSIHCLLTPGRAEDAALAATLRERLKLDDGERDALLIRLRLVPSHPTRDTIQAQNLRLLMNNQAGHLSADVLKTVYDRILLLIFEAMQARALPSKWKETFLTKGVARGKAATTFLQKRLLSAHFAAFAEVLSTTPQPLLRRMIDGKEQLPTQLEQKLILGGASLQIIEHAKMLRANASRREYEVLAGEMFDDGVLEDLKTRLLVRAHGLIDEHGAGKKPAAAIWNRLLQMLSEQCTVIDSRGVFTRDPDLLLGQICDLSDQCRSGWGIADA